MGVALAGYALVVALAWAVVGAPAAVFLVAWLALAIVLGCVLGRVSRHGRDEAVSRADR